MATDARISIRVKPEFKAKVDQYIAENNTNLTDLIVRCLTEEIEGSFEDKVLEVLRKHKILNC